MFKEPNLQAGTTLASTYFPSGGITNAGFQKSIAFFECASGILGAFVQIIMQIVDPIMAAPTDPMSYVEAVNDALGWTVDHGIENFKGCIVFAELVSAPAPAPVPVSP